MGINTLIYTAGAERGEETPGIGINLATPSDLAASVLEDIVKYGRVIRGWLGVSVEVLFSEGIATPPVQQLIVTNLAAGGPAERAGIRLNDIIVAMDGEPVVDGRAADQAAAVRYGRVRKGRPTHARHASMAQIDKHIPQPPRDKPSWHPVHLWLGLQVHLT